MQNNGNFDIIEYLDSLSPDVIHFFQAILLAIGVFIALRIIRFFLRLFRGKSPNFVDGLTIILNFTGLIGYIYLIGWFNIYTFDSNLALGGSVFTITIIGISASYLGSNLMAGIFIIITRPFGVGDIITYGGTRGLVTDIGLNYTKILKINKVQLTIPNSNIVNAVIHNSSIFINHTAQKSDGIEIDIQDEDAGGDSKAKLSDKIRLNFSPEKLTKPLLKSLDIKKLVRFTFNIEIRQDFGDDVSINSYEKKLKSLCQSFTEKFGFEPEFYFDNNYWRINTWFIITALNAGLVFQYYSPFLESLLKTAYNIDVGGT